MDESSAFLSLVRPRSSSPYREVAAAGTYIVSGVVEVDGAVASDTLIEPTHDQRVCRPFRDVVTPGVRGGVGNAVVWIAGITSGKPNDLPRRTSIRLNDCHLEPRVHVIAAERIDSIEAQDDYVEILAEGKPYLKNQRLSELEEQLDQTRFVRLHRSWIVNVERIERIEQATKDSHCAVLKDGRKIPVSRSGYQKVKGL